MAATPALAAFPVFESGPDGVNGIGFNEKYCDRIFTPFQRLHGRAEYEGSGMGLAICLRIVERHGGKISVESAEGEGSRFTVILPARQGPARGED